MSKKKIKKIIPKVKSKLVKKNTKTTSLRKCPVSCKSSAECSGSLACDKSICCNAELKQEASFSDSVIDSIYTVQTRFFIMIKKAYNFITFN